MKGSKFSWSQEAEAAFSLLKSKVTEAHVLILPDFEEVFEVHYDASGVEIGGVVVGFEIFKEIYGDDPDFAVIWDTCQDQPY
ncbi:putative CCCH-type zinc finger family protein [Tanacetum coccineum]